MEQKINNKIEQKIKKFVFWKTFITICFITSILLVTFFQFLGSFEEDFWGPFIVVLFFSVILALLFTFLIKWTEEYKFMKKTIENRRVKYNELAIIGLILSIISIFGIGLAGLIGLILGIIALVQIKYTHEVGKGLAITAIIIGFIWSFGVSILGKLIELGY